VEQQRVFLALDDAAILALGGLALSHVVQSLPEVAHHAELSNRAGGQSMTLVGCGREN